VLFPFRRVLLPSQFFTHLKYRRSVYSFLLLARFSPVLLCFSCLHHTSFRTERPLPLTTIQRFNRALFTYPSPLWVFIHSSFSSMNSFLFFSPVSVHYSPGAIDFLPAVTPSPCFRVAPVLLASMPPSDFLPESHPPLAYPPS